eukprot:CAMPEP_0177724362 /NCGR_PEP_ID=MMETSP0484_2-20121128/18691_1 /TAXON_ID=354590 /ORGANISM="Rhodomonas lens, Strain RHODO" /LENGTH=331 /DNA_ID=CAMNT_0019236831 /DNA_START=85 /DNA_END=1076 /DNA_ORIENTATION=-
MDEEFMMAPGDKDADGGEEATTRVWKSTTGNSQNCYNRQRCSESFRENCVNGCNPKKGVCKTDNEVCGDTWASNFASGFCGSGNLPSGYVSWKSHMSNDASVCAGISGENCLHLGARNDAAWFPQNLRVFPVPKVACDPSPGPNASLYCMNGTIPAELQSASFFAASNTQTEYMVTEASLLESGQPASVTVSPAQCQAAWSSFSCQRNIPECRNNNAESAGCYDACEEVSRCLDAFLLLCVNLSTTAAGTGDCASFDWSTAPSGGTCNPGFECQGIQADSTLTAVELRNCRGPLDKCEDRPYMLNGGYCQRGDDLPNLCDQFQQDPTARSG